ncbi:hypothetical protein MMC17_002754 [Xylographa soralifera]|nr:hypothetical protein [Xylographa soralifera]
MRGEISALASEQSRNSSSTNQHQLNLTTTLSTLARDQSASAHILRRIDRNLAAEITIARRAADAHDITRSILSSSNFSDSIASQPMPDLQPKISKAIEKAFQNTIGKRETVIEMQDLTNGSSTKHPQAYSQNHHNTQSPNPTITDSSYVVLPG